MTAEERDKQLLLFLWNREILESSPDPLAALRQFLAKREQEQEPGRYRLVTLSECHATPARPDPGRGRRIDVLGRPTTARSDQRNRRDWAMTVDVATLTRVERRSILVRPRAPQSAPFSHN